MFLSLCHCQFSPRLRPAVDCCHRLPVMSLRVFFLKTSSAYKCRIQKLTNNLFIITNLCRKKKVTPLCRGCSFWLQK